VFWTYRPALKHPPRQDQWCFLLDTVHEDRFWPMLMQTYSYNRTRVISWGDYPLFRPCLFAILVAEKAFFGTRYVYPQAIGIALHGAIVWVFLRLLLRLHHLYPPGSAVIGRLRFGLAHVLAGFFAVNIAGTEMVTWSHIQGYLLYLLCLLGGLLLLVDELCGFPPARRAWRLGGAFFLTLVAAFCYETGSVYAFCLGAVLALVWAGRGQIRHGLLLFALFASILPIYKLTDWLDRLSHPLTRPDITEASVLEKAHWQPTLAHAGRYALFTLGQPFFPSCAQWSFEHRIWLAEPGQAPGLYWRREKYLFISYAVVLAAAGLAVGQLARLLADRRALAGSLFLLLPVGLIALHMGIIVLGRMNMRPDPLVLARNSYYAYTPFLLFLLGLYYLWVRLPLVPARPVVVALVVLLAGLGVLSVTSARKVHAMTTHIRSSYCYRRHHIEILEQLIDQHRHDPFFGISFDPEAYYALEEFYGLCFEDVLFCRFFDHEHPTHVVCARGNKWCVLSEPEYCRLHGGPGYRSLPTFVQATTGYMVFRHQQRYYALDIHEGRFRTGQDGYCSLLEGETLAEVLRQIPETDRAAGH
jgi:hypothetical protein